MEMKKYTNDIYVPIGKLSHLSPNLLDDVVAYREKFKEIIALDDLDFSFLVETPQLIKKRFNINVELAKTLKQNFKTNDFILEISKLIVENKELPFSIKAVIKEKLIHNYLNAGKDLTTITTYLESNILNFIKNEQTEDISHTLPSLSDKDKKFIEEFNNATHSYSIQDYIKVVSCSYETARSSLEKMEKLNLYIKKKQGKKYVYQPTNKLALIMKGEW